jgi:acetolactate synthase-1/2/3 large subunit
MGVKFSHNGAHGFRLALPHAHLIHVDASPEVLGANYEASLTLAADVPALIRAFVGNTPTSGRAGASEWTSKDVASWNEVGATAISARPEPTTPDLASGTMAAFFEALRQALPADSCLVLDSGLHQMLARRHFRVLRSRGLILPTDFQAMGFALPAAIAAKLARPERSVAALLGDGGFSMSAPELVTAAREGLALTVIVFNDGRYGLIHRKQIRAYGHSHGTLLKNPDIRAISEGSGAKYLLLAGDPGPSLASAIGGKGVTVVEVVVTDSSQGSLKGALGTLVSKARRFSKRG